MENKEEQKEVNENNEVKENTSDFEEKYFRNIDKDTLSKEMDEDEEYLSNGEDDNNRYPTEDEVDAFTDSHRNTYKAIKERYPDLSKEELSAHYFNCLPENEQKKMLSLRDYDQDKFESIFNDDSSDSKPKVKRLVKNYEDDYIKRR